MVDLGLSLNVLCFKPTDSMSMMSAVKALGSAVQPQSTVDFGLSFWWSTVYWPRNYSRAR